MGSFVLHVLKNAHFYFRRHGMFEKGSLMVYDTAGVCRVEDIGVPEGLPAAREGREYYKLSPVFGSGIIYIPVDTKVFMRPVISAGFRKSVKIFVSPTTRRRWKITIRSFC